MVNSMNEETQRANDMLLALQAQRDQALNALVAAQAEIMSLRRQLAEKQNDTKPRGKRRPRISDNAL
jgi:conjugal transfer/entry exclusion protein